jgi:hypothetical protein
LICALLAVPASSEPAARIRAIWSVFGDGPDDYSSQGINRVRGPTGGIGMVKVGVQQVGVDDVDHGKGGAVGDAPQGSQHVTAADQLQRPGQVERLIQQPQVTGGGGLALEIVPLRSPAA